MDSPKKPSYFERDKSFDLYKIEEENMSSSQISSMGKDLKDCFDFQGNDTETKIKKENENSFQEEIPETNSEKNLNSPQENNTAKRKYGSAMIKNIDSNNLLDNKENSDVEQEESSEDDDEYVRESNSINGQPMDQIEFIENDNQLEKTLSNISFFEGRPKDEEEIFKLECPLYRCGRNTIVTKKVIQPVIRLPDKSGKSGSFMANTKLTLRRGKSHHEFQKSTPANYKRKNALVDINIANTFELRTFNSLFMTILQIINCIIRYTIVQFPFCIKTLGLIYGPIIISIIGSMSIFSVYMLIKVKECTGESSYSAFAYKWWGIKGKIFQLILNCFSSFGSCLSYIIIFLKVIPKLVNLGIGETIIADKKVLSILLGLWLLVYCYKKDISGIKAAAFWGVLGIISYLIMNIVNLLYSSWMEEIPEDKHINFMHVDWLISDTYSCIACIILSFSFHTYVFSIYECLDFPDAKKMIVTSSIGIFVSMLIYLLVGTIGYILYGETISDSILDSLEYSSLGILENISFVVNVVMSFPITFSGLKHYFIFIIGMVVTLIKHSLCKKKKSKSADEKKNDKKGNLKRSKTNFNKYKHKEQKEDDNDDKSDKSDEEENHGHGHMKLVNIPEYIEYILILCIFGLIFYTAITHPNMKALFGILGATTANLFSFILPAMYFIKFSKHNVCSLQNILPFIFIIVGLIGLVVCLSSNILSLVNGGH